MYDTHKYNEPYVEYGLLKPVIGLLSLKHLYMGVSIKFNKSIKCLNKPYSKYGSFKLSFKYSN